MSTIAAAQKAGRVAIAWDTLTTCGSTRCVGAVRPSKVLKAGSSFIACAGLSVYYNLLDHYLAGRKAPRLDSERSVFSFFVEFWTNLRRRYHFVDDRSDREAPAPFADLGAEFLVASPHGIFRVKEILSVSRFERFCCIGSGAPHAEGALLALYERLATARDLAREAVHIALEFDAASGGDVEVVALPRLGVPGRRIAQRVR